MRIMVADALRADPDIEVIGTATNGKDGVDKTISLNPDVVITDMVMPQYDGLYAVTNIMKNKPVPIILLSSLGRANPEIFKALNAGAFDFFDKPSSNDSIKFRQALAKLTQKIKVASGIDVGALGKKANKVHHEDHVFGSTLQYDIVAIGASTGGPSTIESILDQLPQNLAIPVVIVQHMPERFLASYAQRLNSIIPLPVQLAHNEEYLKAGRVYILKGDGNMKIETDEFGRSYFRYSDQKYKEYDSPSIDCLFESVADVYGSKAIGIILTGMGRDGSQGLKKIKIRGGLTIAQDAESCIVNGMPKSAVEIGAIDYVVKLKEIPGFVISCF